MHKNIVTRIKQTIKKYKKNNQSLEKGESKKPMVIEKLGIDNLICVDKIKQKITENKLNLTCDLDPIDTQYYIVGDENHYHQLVQDCVQDKDIVKFCLRKDIIEQTILSLDDEPLFHKTLAELSQHARERIKENVKNKIMQYRATHILDVYDDKDVPKYMLFKIMSHEQIYELLDKYFGDPQPIIGKKYLPPNRTSTFGLSGGWLGERDGDIRVEKYFKDVVRDQLILFLKYEKDEKYDPLLDIMSGLFQYAPQKMEEIENKIREKIRQDKDSEPYYLYKTVKQEIIKNKQPEQIEEILKAYFDNPQIKYKKLVETIYFDTVLNELREYSKQFLKDLKLTPQKLDNIPKYIHISKYIQQIETDPGPMSKMELWLIKQHIRDILKWNGGYLYSQIERISEDMISYLKRKIDAKTVEILGPRGICFVPEILFRVILADLPQDVYRKISEKIKDKLQNTELDESVKEMIKKDISEDQIQTLLKNYFPETIHNIPWYKFGSQYWYPNSYPSYCRY